MLSINPSERLCYQMMTKHDAELFVELDQNPEVMRYINGGKTSTMDDVLNVLIPRLESYLNIEKGWGIWSVRLRDSGEFIGWVLIRPMDFFSEHVAFDNLELGWRFKEHTWGQGFATEAAKSIRDALIAKGGITKLSAIALEGNNASFIIMEKLGMHYLKTGIHKDPLGDEEVVYYEMNV
jgi:RimJ/RimL family protein N-acetyltransferase